MLNIRLIEALPENFDAFVQEIGQGLVTIYGLAAEEDYHRRARAIFLGNIAHPEVVGVGAYDGERMAGMVFGLRHGAMAEVSFIHVLGEYAGCGIEQLLVKEVVRQLWRDGIKGIVAECIPLCPVELHDPFLQLGFEHIARQLMRGKTEEIAGGVVGRSRPMLRKDFEAAAECIVDAYAVHAGRRLHFEVGNTDRALAFVERVMQGSLGRMEEGFARVVDRESQCLGVILGCEIAPGTGFVLHVAVRREAQGQGIGQMLVRDLARSFFEYSMPWIVLGVTLDNPALRLYERLGFSMLRPVDAYIKWRELSACG
ncbi:MAG TPA: GNAT family N-acetyltransferase [Candidatus Hydrogenedentes bacterium]|nr:GNAT family N-acetyltransferase [Candidatus Hydrogenedentota bacterium]